MEAADLYGDFEDAIDEELEEAAEQDDRTRSRSPAPDEAELRAGFARIAAQLTEQGG